MKLSSFYIALTLLFVYSLSGYAQRGEIISVNIKVVKQAGEGTDIKEDVEGARVYVFKNDQDAKDFYHAQSQNAAMSETGGVYREVNDKAAVVRDSTDHNGLCQVSAYSNWFIVASLFDGEWLSDVIPISGKSDIEIEVVSKVKQLKNVDTFAKGNNLNLETIGVQIGDLRKIIFDYDIYGADATYRYGLSPFATVAGESYGFTSEYQNRNPEADSLLKNMVPYVIEGERFGNTQLRKMGYDKNNDPLSAYVDTSQKIKTHSKAPIIFRVRDALQPADQDAVYPVYALLWRENYGDLVVIKSELVNPGYARNPMRFLDFALPDIEINADHYFYRPINQLNKGTESLPLNFVSGKAEISPTDTVGMEMLDKIIDKLESIRRNNGNVYSISIHGYASPEGGKAVNERLSRQRSDYLVNIIKRQLGGVGSETGATVASWKEVADLLRADSISDPENISRAEEIEQIIASSSSDAQIDSRMQSSHLYRFLKENEEKYYKPLRKVEISYEYSVARVLTREEVIQRYENKEEILYPYQFQYLFEYLKDRPEELGPVAKKAMGLTETRKMNKPWALAAYYLAKNYLARDTCDITLLKPYIIEPKSNDTITPFNVYVDSICKVISPNSYAYLPKAGINVEQRSMDNSKSVLQYINDEGIVMQQLSMLIKAKKIVEAANLARVLPNEPKYKQIKVMLDCLSGKWEVDSVRLAVAATSAWNKVVVYAAQSNENKEKFWKDAWETLHNDSTLHMDTPRELYMKATLAYRLFTTAKNWNKRTDDKTPVNTRFFETENFDVLSNAKFEDDDYPWGAIMIKACEMSPSLIKTLKFDGEFNQNYRDGFAAYWNEKHPDNILK